MSKSKGNVINPIVLVDKYGADAFRAALLFGTAQGGMVALSEDKVRAMRNFANKLWNMGRFIEMNRNISSVITQSSSHKVVVELKKEFEAVQKKYTKHMEGYKFSAALNEMYEFTWHRLADFYIEALKEELYHGNIEVSSELEKVYVETLKMLHPFMPFVTDAIYKQFNSGKRIIN